MHCDRCESTASVHLTEVVRRADGTRGLREVHLCLPHAMEMGVISAGLPVLPEPGSESAAADTGLPLSIVPSVPVEQGLVLAKGEGGHGEPNRCPTCGTTWQDFRRTGLMGCPGDYTFFEARLMPLLKKAQEQHSQHCGKTPGAQVEPSHVREIETLRLHRELDRALADENYEQAARVRDQLRTLGDHSR